MNPKQLTRKHPMIYLPFAALIALLVLFLSQIQLAEAQQTYPGYTIFSTGVSRSMIPANSVYTRETRIGSFRPGYQEWGCPVFRIPANESHPMVTVTNTSSGRVETWPIPTYAVPANAADGHMCIVNLGTQTVYEFFEAVWTGTSTISAGGMVAFPMSANGISNPPHRRVTASGFANMFGMIRREDFINPSTGQLDPNNTVLTHALTINLPPAILGNNTFVSPAVGGEVSGNASSNGIPMGALFALPRNLDVDALNVHPIVRTILRAARDYGLYVADGTGTANYGGNYAGTIEMEPQLLVQLYGQGSSNDYYMETIQSQVFSVISQYGIYRVTAGTGPVPTNTPVPATNTPVPPATSTPRPTNTVVPPTSTPRPTNTPTSTPRPSNTPVSPTVTPRPTDVGGGQDLTPTQTPRPTNTATPRPTNTATPRATNTATPGATNTATPRATNTATPRPTNTATPRATNTATPRLTNTVVPPTSTPRPTNTVVPPTSTPRPTNTPTATPISSAVGSHIIIPSTVNVNTNFNVTIRLDNPASAPGGGVGAMEVQCSVSPTSRLIGQSYANGTVFGPNPVIIVNPTTSSITYAVSQSGSNPPVRTGGTVLSLTIRAATRGTATITCTASIIDATGVETNLTVAPVTFTVR